MGKLLSGSIDLSKIDKSRIKEGKNGQKYYDILISINDEADQFGNDAGIMQQQTKEEREAKTKKVYLGNAKTFWSSDGKLPGKKDSDGGKTDDPDDDLPF